MTAGERSPSSDAAKEASAPTARRQPGAAALTVLCMAQFMLVLDIAIVNVALPAIQRQLHFSRGDLQFVVTAYALTFGGLLLLGGRLADALGRRRLFMIGLALFTLSSFVCGLSPAAAVLVAARAAQGVGGALVAPAALSLLTTIYAEGAARNRALGVWSALAAGGGAAGLVLGGALASLAGWRWVFLVNVPLGLAVLAAAPRVLPAGTPARRGRVDLAGGLLVTVGLIGLVYGLARGGQDGFGSEPVIALLAGAVAMIGAFVLVEGRVPEPLAPLSIFRLRTLDGANLATVLLSAVVVGVNYFLTLYCQEVLGLSPIETGLAFVPMTAAAALASGLAARLVAVLGARSLLLGGMIVLAGGAALLGRLTARGTYLRDVLPGTLLVAVGLGVGFTVGTVAATAGVEARRQGVASAILATSQQIGGALGLAILTAVASAGTGAGEASLAALTRGFRAAFLVAGGFGLLAALAVALLIGERECGVELRRRGLEGAGAPPAGNAHAAPCLPGIAQLAAGAAPRQRDGAS